MGDELSAGAQMLAWIASGGALTWLGQYLIDRRKQRLEEKRQADEVRARALEEQRLAAEQKGADFERIKKAWDEWRVEMRQQMQELSRRNDELEAALQKQGEECAQQRREDARRFDDVTTQLQSRLVAQNNQIAEQQMELNRRKVEISELQMRQSQAMQPGGRRQTDLPLAGASALPSLSPLVPPGASFDLRVSAPGAPPPDSHANGGGQAS